MVSLARRTASASSSNGITAAIGPKTSSRATRAPRVDGREHGRREPEAGAVRRAAAEGDGRAVVEEGGHAVALGGGDQRAHLGALVERVADAQRLHAAARAAPGSASSAARCTRMRERAQQSWPALPNTASGAAAAAASRSASAKTMLADLPPSSSVTRLIVAAAPAAIERPTSVEPVKAILATSGCSTRRCPQVRPGSDDDVDDALRHAGLERDLGEPQRRQRRQLGRLEHDRVAGRQRRRELPGGDRRAGSSMA